MPADVGQVCPHLALVRRPQLLTGQDLRRLVQADIFVGEQCSRRRTEERSCRFPWEILHLPPPGNSGVYSALPGGVETCKIPGSDSGRPYIRHVAHLPFRDEPG